METSRQTAILLWVLLRALRWLLWIVFFAVSYHVRANQASIMTSFGHLPFEVELVMFALGCGAVFAGFLELMARERTGFPRPAFGRDWRHPRQAA